MQGQQQAWHHGRAWHAAVRVAGGPGANEELPQERPGGFPSAVSCCRALQTVTELSLGVTDTSCQKVKPLPFYSLL